MKRYNFSNIIKWIEITLTIMVVLNFAMTFYVINQLNRSSMDSVINRLSTDINNISDHLSGIHSMMQAEVGYDKDLDTLLVADTKKTQIDEVTIINRIKGIISNWSKELTFPVHYALYFPGNGIIINDADNNEEYDLWRKVQNDIIHKINAQDFKSNWNIVELGGEYYLVDIIGINRKYILAYIKLQEVVQSLQSDFYGQDYYIAVTDAEDRVYYHQEELQKDKIVASKEKNGIIRRSIIKQMLVVKRNVKEGIDFVMVIHNYNSVLNSFWLQLVLISIMIAIVIMVLFFLQFINKTILLPIQSFNRNIENLKNEEMYNVATHYQINELGNASKLMSEMVERIKGLKIDIYEKTLEQQKTTMDFLTLQIEPHFYLNCLNIIYNMAQLEQYKEIQRLSNYVSEYLRYIFKSRESFASVREELEHIKKYLEIQKIRYGNCFEVQITMDDRLMEVNIPPLVLQTFVENSLKHTINWEDDIELSLTGYIEDVEAVIRVEDTGEGYDKEILKKLQLGIDISEGDRRIGIMNAISRMRLTYGNTATLRFYNRIEGGAGVEIRFPITN